MSIDVTFLYDPIHYYSENMRFAKAKLSIFVKFYKEPGNNLVFPTRRCQVPGTPGGRY
jgi:hypothetical protein